MLQKRNLAGKPCILVVDGRNCITLGDLNADGERFFVARPAADGTISLIPGSLALGADAAIVPAPGARSTSPRRRPAAEPWPPNETRPTTEPWPPNEDLTADDARPPAPTRLPGDAESTAGARSAADAWPPGDARPADGAPPGEAWLPGDAQPADGAPPGEAWLPGDAQLGDGAWPSAEAWHARDNCSPNGHRSASGAWPPDTIARRASAALRRASASWPRATRRQYFRSLGNVPDGTVVGYQGRRAFVRRGLLHVDGEPAAFTSPTPAARRVNGGTVVNGWIAWRDPTGLTLADLHDE